VRPRVVQLIAGRPTAPESHRIDHLTPATLAAIQQGLRRVVADPLGTAHATVYRSGLDVAGKTGTAESGGGRPSHAWMAGYLPADDPRWAVTVVIEHGGRAGTAAGPVFRRIAEELTTRDSPPR
jgi:penicillin-binding protein 2